MGIASNCTSTDFEKSLRYRGHIAGMVFKTGDRGTGYYRDGPVLDDTHTCRPQYRLKLSIHQCTDEHIGHPVRKVTISLDRLIPPHADNDHVGGTGSDLGTDTVDGEGESEGLSRTNPRRRPPTAADTDPGTTSSPADPHQTCSPWSRQRADLRQIQAAAHWIQRNCLEAAAADDLALRSQLPATTAAVSTPMPKKVR